MSSDGKSERFWPSTVVCWFVQLLCPESRMLSEPETFSAGPPGPRMLVAKLGSCTGNASCRPWRAAGVAPAPSELRSRRERSCQRCTNDCRMFSEANCASGAR